MVAVRTLPSTRKCAKMKDFVEERKKDMKNMQIEARKRKIIINFTKKQTKKEKLMY